MIRLVRQVTKRCPFRDEVDVGELTLIYTGEAPELHALAERIDKYGQDTKMTHEVYTDGLATLLCGTPPALIQTKWTTGPWECECSI